MLHSIGIILYFFVTTIILLGIIPHIFSPGKFLDDVSELRSKSALDQESKRFFNTQGAVYMFGFVLNIICLATINWPIAIVSLVIWNIPVIKMKTAVSVKYAISSALLIIGLVNITSVKWTIHLAVASLNISF